MQQKSVSQPRWRHVAARRLVGSLIMVSGLLIVSSDAVRALGVMGLL